VESAVDFFRPTAGGVRRPRVTEAPHSDRGAPQTAVVGLEDCDAAKEQARLAGRPGVSARSAAPSAASDATLGDTSASRRTLPPMPLGLAAGLPGLASLGCSLRTSRPGSDATRPMRLAAVRSNPESTTLRRLRLGAGGGAKSPVDRARCAGGCGDPFATLPGLGACAEAWSPVGCARCAGGCGDAFATLPERTADPNDRNLRVCGVTGGGSAATSAAVATGSGHESLCLTTLFCRPRAPELPGVPAWDATVTGREGALGVPARGGEKAVDQRLAVLVKPKLPVATLLDPAAPSDALLRSFGNPNG